MKQPNGMTLSLQVCETCGQIQYPAREVCRSCLSDALMPQDVPSTGIVLAGATVHIGLQPMREAPLPLQLVTVKLDCGVHLIAATKDALRLGDAVSVVRQDDRLWAVLVTKNEGGQE